MHPDETLHPTESQPVFDARDSHGHSLKKAMINGLHAASAEIVEEALANTRLPEDHADHVGDAYLEALNKELLTIGAHVAKAINTAGDFQALLEQLKDASEWALARDASDSVSIPEESACYRMLVKAFESGVAHLDPKDKRFHLAATKGEKVIMLHGADLLSRQAMYLESLMQQYQERFNQQGVTMEHDDNALAELDAADLLPVQFARSGMVSDDELYACIDDALKHTFCLYRDSAAGYDDSDDKDDLLERNAAIYKELHEQVEHARTGQEPLRPLQAIMDVLDHMIARDFQSRPHDHHEPLHATWVSDFISYLQDMVKVNAGKDNGTDPRSVTYLMAEFAGMQQLIDSYPEARLRCHAIIREQYGHKGTATAHEVVAGHHALDLDTLDEEEYLELNRDIVDNLQKYIRTHFFDRVNSMQLSSKEGAISLDFDYDDEGVDQTYLLHSYALVHRAYEMAERSTPDTMKGTQMYERLLKRNQDHFLSALAKSDAWQCHYPDQYTCGEQALSEAYAAKNRVAER